MHIPHLQGWRRARAETFSRSIEHPYAFKSLLYPIVSNCNDTHTCKQHREERQKIDYCSRPKGLKGINAILVSSFLPLVYEEST